MLQKLREANLARNDEWDTNGQLTGLFFSNELAGEVGEACNVVKKLERERLGLAGSRDTIEHLAEELADVLICVDLLAIAYGVDLEKALPTKFNKTSAKLGLSVTLKDD